MAVWRSIGYTGAIVASVLFPALGCGSSEPESPPPGVQGDADELTPPTVEMPDAADEASGEGEDSSHPAGSQTR